VPPDLDALLTALYVLADDFLPRRRGPGRPPRISDAELACLAIAQVLLDCPNERRFLRLAKGRLGHLFPYIPGQSGYNKRVRALAPTLARLIERLAWLSPSWNDRLRLLDSTPVPCAQSRETVKRSALAGYGTYGYCQAHARYFWGFRLYSLCAPDGMPIACELAPANAPERDVAAELLERALQAGQIVIADKGFAGREFEHLVHGLGARLLRPDRKDEPARHGSLGRVRQWIESAFQTCKGQLSLERHGARSLPGLCARVLQRLLALAAAIWHNHETANHHSPRSLVAYDH
jgi:Transposase DDE domain